MLNFQKLFDEINNTDLSDLVIQSPLEPLKKLSNKLSCSIYLKREDKQSVFSFKIRGAFNKVRDLYQHNNQVKLIAVSAGNHAQGVAVSAKYFNLDALIVMPKTTPSIKVDAVKSYGVQVVLAGDNYDEAALLAQSLALKEKRDFIHPYDDLMVIKGQATIAKELQRQLKDPPDEVYIPVGGGGLIAGMALYLKHIWPKVKVIGVEPIESASMYEALKANKRVCLDHVGIFADGVAVKQVGQIPFEIAKQYVDDIVLVDTDEICASIKDLFEETRTIAEPAGALSLAAIKKCSGSLKDKRVVSILCGSNVNFDRLRHIAERAEIGQQNEALFAVKLPERTGSLLKFCKTLHQHAITEFNYRYQSSKGASVFVGIGLNQAISELALHKSLKLANHSCVNLTHNELAKLHIRYMIGGAHKVENEQLFRFRFPERPRALMDFLVHIGQEFNISLFHYRNHGAAFGRVLIGLQISPEQRGSFVQKAKSLGYFFEEESDNEAYELFLSE